MRAGQIPFERIAAAIEYLYDHAREQHSLDDIASLMLKKPARSQPCQAASASNSTSHPPPLWVF
ncbi:MAG: hypothetical protein Q4A11_07230 [Brachymonas sp.]|nr:hypothetical protein [Brachymonas sp.]